MAAGYAQQAFTTDEGPGSSLRKMVCSCSSGMAHCMKSCMVPWVVGTMYSGMNASPNGDLGSRSLQRRMGSLVSECVMAKMPFS